VEGVSGDTQSSDFDGVGTKQAGIDMQFKEYDVVRLIAFVPDCSIPLGSVGTILVIHEYPYEAYEVEFLDEAGEPIGICILRPNQLSPL
jgi:hypothetical protein